MDVDSFFELLSKCQSKRMDDQRCTLTVDPNKENKEPLSAVSVSGSEPPPRPNEDPSIPPTANGGVINSDSAAAASGTPKYF